MAYFSVGHRAHTFLELSVVEGSSSEAFSFDGVEAILEDFFVAFFTSELPSSD